MPEPHEVGPVSSLPPGAVTGKGIWAVGNSQGDLFAVTRRCRHLYADLANGSIDSKGCLVCPWHGYEYELQTGECVGDRRLRLKKFDVVRRGEDIFVVV